jgi:hypothetical protein
MEKRACLIYENGVRFARFFYGTLLGAAVFFGVFEIVVLVMVLMALGAVSSMKLNLFYQLYLLLSGKRKIGPPDKDLSEACFACYLGSGFLLLAVVFFYFFHLKTIAWILSSAVSFLSLLAGIGGLCVGSLLYVLFKKALGHFSQDKRQAQQ